MRLSREPRAEELVAVGLRFNPPPGWPPVPEGFTPPPGWQPDPSWPPPPPGWQLWVTDDQPLSDNTMPLQAVQPGDTPLPGYGADGRYGTLPGTGSVAGFGAPYTPYGSQVPPPRSGKMSGWAIASFILSVPGVVILSVIFGFIALRNIKRLGQRGRGFAIAGLVLSGLWIIIIILAVIAANTGKAARSSATGLITRSGRINVFSLNVADCFDNPAGARTVNVVTAIPCDQPHNAQIYAKFKLTGSGSGYPGAATVARLARSGCDARIGSLNKSMTNSAMSIRIFLPEEAAWLGGRRTVSCMVVSPKDDLTSSLLNASPETG
jgi:hypothetical protein